MLCENVTFSYRLSGHEFRAQVVQRTQETRDGDNGKGQRHLLVAMQASGECETDADARG